MLTFIKNGATKDYFSSCQKPLTCHSQVSRGGVGRVAVTAGKSHGIKCSVPLPKRVSWTFKFTFENYTHFGEQVISVTLIGTVEDVSSYLNGRRRTCHIPVLFFTFRWAFFFLRFSVPTWLSSAYKVSEEFLLW